MQQQHGSAAARPANDEATILAFVAELTREICGRGRLVRRQLAKLIQAGSIPVVRSVRPRSTTVVHRFRKPEVSSSILDEGSMMLPA